MPHFLLLVPVAAPYARAAPLQLLLEPLIDGERDGLAGRDAHDPRRDALVKRVDAFLSVAGRVQRWGVQTVSTRFLARRTYISLPIVAP